MTARGHSIRIAVEAPTRPSIALCKSVPSNTHHCPGAWHELKDDIRFAQQTLLSASHDEDADLYTLWDVFSRRPYVTTADVDCRIRAWHELKADIRFAQNTPCRASYDEDLVLAQDVGHAQKS